MRGRALLFGLNYPGTPAELRGCVNDVVDMGAFLDKLGIKTTVFTDGPHTTAVGMVSSLAQLAMQTYSERLDFVWIHYSGHGASVVDRDDEADGFDECLVPSDYTTAGVIPDDFVSRLLRNINPKTRVVFVCDACHSGTICDVKYSWDSARRTIENPRCAVRAKVLCISGCLDNQTSADAPGLTAPGRFSGALTAFLLKAMAERPLWDDVFALHASVVEKLKANGFEQRPKLCSTYDLCVDRKLFCV